MQKLITSIDSLNCLLGSLEHDFISQVLAVIGRLLAAVHCFFQ